MDDSTPQPQPRPLDPSRTQRVWWLIVLSVVLLIVIGAFFVLRWFLAETAPAREPIPVASFRADFLPEHPKAGWHYYWNRNGPVGDTNGYVELIWNGTLYATSESEVPAPPPAHYLRLSDIGGHPGQGPSQRSSHGIDYEYAVIVAFTVPASGNFVIVHTFLSRRAGAKQGFVCLQVYVNNRNSGSEERS